MRTDASPQTNGGVFIGATAYVLWGLLPLYFTLLAPAGPWEILAHRVLWSLPICLSVLGRRRQLGDLRPIFANWRRAALLVGGSLTIGVNWTIYIAAVTTGHVADASLGSFFNPLATIVLGVALLRERLRPLQWGAVGTAAAAAAVLTANYGGVPWISFLLAGTFALYSLIKKRVGVAIPPLQSLTAETIVLYPVVIALLTWLSLTPSTTPVTHQTFTSHGSVHALWLVSTGLVTSIPMVLFAAAAARLTLVTVGLLQFITPVLQLLIAVAVMHETIPLSRWAGFGILWVALLLLMTDMLRTVGSGRRVRPSHAGAA